MKYKNAQDVLPDHLLKELQQYVCGESLYVPNIRAFYKKRNEEIRSKYNTGSTLEELAEEYSLSADSIRKIVY